MSGNLPDLVLSLADNKQMLGLRYAEWATRAPSLEADIAAAAMGLDDLGHSRVLYGCLEPLGSDPREPERDSDPARIRNLAYFDDPWTEWSQFVAANAILDTAFTVVIEACVNGSVEVLRQRLRKMLMEERYHFLHGRSWLRSGIETAPLLQAWQEALEFFGPPGSDVDGLSMGPEKMRARLEDQLETKAPEVIVHWEVWDPLRRRTAEGEIDEHTFSMLRGLEEKKYAPNHNGPMNPPHRSGEVGRRPRGEPRAEPACPHCKARDAEVISLFGTQAMTLQYRCRRCGTVFEAIKYEV